MTILKQYNFSLTLCVLSAVIVNNTASPFFGFGNFDSPLNFWRPATTERPGIDQREMRAAAEAMSVLHSEYRHIQQVARALILLSQAQPMLKIAADHMALTNSTTMRRAALELMKINAEDSNIRRATRELVTLHQHKYAIYQGSRAASVMITLKTNGYNVL